MAPASRHDRSAAPPPPRDRSALPSSLSARVWQSLTMRPHSFVLISFGVAILLLSLLLLRGLLLTRDRDIKSLEQMQAVRAERIDARLQLEAERLTSVRNYAEHLLTIQESLPPPPDADLASAYAHRNDDTWSVPSHDAAAIAGVGPAQLQALDGFTRRDATLLSGMAVARSLSHLLSAAPLDSGFAQRMAYVSNNGFLVSYPPTREQDVGAALRRYAQSRYFRDNLPAANPGRKLQWHVAASTAEPGDISLFLSVPVYAADTFRGVAILEIPRRSLDDALSLAPYHDVNSYLVHRRGMLVGASTRNVRSGETLGSALAGRWPAETTSTIFGRPEGSLDNGAGSRLIFRRVGNGDLAMVDEISTHALLLGSATRLSGAIGAGAAALGILLCATLAVVHTLFGHFLARGEALRTLAETDALTGLSNRRDFGERFAVAASQCARNQQPLSLVMLDIDHFKQINDGWGHASGDIVLKAVADALRGSVRKDDLPARLGGEEFAIVLPRARKDDAAAVAEQLRRMLQALRCQPAADAPRPDVIHVTASFGVAEMTADAAADLDALLMAADRRLYAAKSGGRNRVVAN